MRIDSRLQLSCANWKCNGRPLFSGSHVRSSTGGVIQELPVDAIFRLSMRIAEPAAQTHSLRWRLADVVVLSRFAAASLGRACLAWATLAFAGSLRAVMGRAVTHARLCRPASTLFPPAAALGCLKRCVVGLAPASAGCGILSV